MNLVNGVLLNGFKSPVENKPKPASLKERLLTEPPHDIFFWIGEVVQFFLIWLMMWLTAKLFWNETFLRVLPAVIYGFSMVHLGNPLVRWIIKRRWS